MKTPDEIKKGLKNAKHVQCMEIASDNENGGVRYGVLVGYVLRDEIVECIQQFGSTMSQVSKALCNKENATQDELLQAVDQLKSRLAQVERERDAAIHDMVQIVHEVDDIACKWCKNAYFDEVKCKECRFHNERFEWQGVQPTNTKDGADA